jgi:hypothetical protein
MPKIHYSEIGSLAWCDQYRDTLDELIEEALDGNKDAELIVVNCAAHFYGLLIADFENFKDFAQAIHDIDYKMVSK